MSVENRPEKSESNFLDSGWYTADASVFIYVNRFRGILDALVSILQLGVRDSGQDAQTASHYTDL